MAIAMSYQFPRYLLLLLLSANTVQRNPVEANSVDNSVWVEPHDAKWAAQVAKNRRLLTRKGRRMLREEFEMKNRKLVVEELTESINNNIENGGNENEENTRRNGNGVRGQHPMQEESQHEDVRHDLRNLVGVSSATPELNVLVVLLQWSNHPDRNTAVPLEDYQMLFNGEGRDDDLYPGGSVKEYFETISHGEMKVNFEVTDWVMTGFSEQEYTSDGSQGRTQEIQNAFVPALDFLDDDFFEFGTQESYCI